MKVLKNIVLCLFMAVSVAGVSTTAVAESDPGRVSYKPADAIDMVVGKIGEAQKALAEGKSAEQLMVLVKAAKDGRKEINANDKVDRANSKATIHLSKAIGLLKEKDTNIAEHLDAAAKEFAALKSLL